MLDQDIQLRASLLLDDTDEGGGAMSADVIQSGVVGNLGIVVADLDRTTGYVFLRKVFPHVDTADRETYYKTTVIISDPPEDANVGACLFTTGDFFDRRDAARDRLERYLAPGVQLSGRVLETQLEGQRAVNLLLSLDDPLPDIGGTYYLVQDEGELAQVEQYIRIEDVTAQQRSFTVTEGGQTVTFRANLVTLALTEPLRDTFHGLPPGRRDDEVSRTVIRDTLVADAARYFGVSPLAAPGAVNDFHVDVDSIYTALVPSAETETAFTDLTAAGERQSLLQAGGSAVFSTSVNIGPGLNLYIGGPFLPGSLLLTVTGGTVTDDGGLLLYAGLEIGAADYAHGVLTFNSESPTFTGAKTCVYTPAAAPIRVADSASIPITADNRGYVYAITLSPIPARGTLLVSYRSLGKWYDLRDTGAGELQGARTAYGAGYLSQTTGTLTLTLGALPDADTALVMVWGTGIQHTSRTGSLPRAEFRFSPVTNRAMVPGTVNFDWTIGATPYHAEDTGTGTLTGAAQGKRTADGWTFAPAQLPPPGTVVTVAYDYGAARSYTVNSPSLIGGYATLQLPHANIVPGSLVITFPVAYTSGQYQALCDAAGIPPDWQIASGQVLAPVVLHDDGAGGWTDGDGVITYSSGLLTIKPLASRQVRRPEALLISNTGPNPSQAFAGWAYEALDVGLPAAGAYITVTYKSNDAPTSATESWTLNTLYMALDDGRAERRVSGTTLVRVGTTDYQDSAGLMVADVNRSTGTATTVGAINHQAGEISLTAWPGNVVNAPASLASVVELSSTAQPVEGITFRIPTAPVRVGSVQVRGTTTGGTAWQATAASDGTLEQSPYVVGTVDYQTGIVSVRFGQWLTAAGNESQPWYDPDLVVSGQIFRSRPCPVDTLRYNAVALTYIPMSADRLGIDPVRLPQDGRVPIFRRGDVLVIHHTGETAVPNPVTPGLVVSAGRARLSRVRVVDANGATVAASTATYTVDLDAGTITFAASGLNLGTAVQPLKLIHRIEDEAVATDVDLGGRIALNKPLSHIFPDGSLVSSALEMGQMQSRAHNLFTQETWTNEWSDSRIGNEPVLQFNTGDYEIAITNEAAITERWALVFTSGTQYKLLGENLGLLAQGIAISQSFAPNNPITGLPYFTIPAGAFGLGGSAGNVFRFNTQAAAYPVWAAVTILPGTTGAVEQDSLEIYIRGNGP